MHDRTLRASRLDTPIGQFCAPAWALSPTNRAIQNEPSACGTKLATATERYRSSRKHASEQAHIRPNVLRQIGEAGVRGDVPATADRNAWAGGLHLGARTADRPIDTATAGKSEGSFGGCGIWPTLVSMSVWSMLEECVGQLNEPFRRSEIVGWFRRHHPEVRESTLAANIQAATGNSANRALNYPNVANRPPLLTHKFLDFGESHRQFAAGAIRQMSAQRVVLRAGCRRLELRNRPRSVGAHVHAIVHALQGCRHPRATTARTVFRDSPRLPAISFFDRPACQCVKISQISITSNVLLAIGPPSLDGGMILTSR
jgi:hypothetical protein